MAAYKHFDVRPLAGAIGAEIRGVDFSKSLPDEVMQEVRQAWLDHLVVVFRDQELTPARQVEVAKMFGEPVEYPFVGGLP
ncbi:MAG: TauD/TfdA family dioxygenase, partial [Alphaproteobacteria bacterium]